jgi:hypothetical protein
VNFGVIGNYNDEHGRPWSSDFLGKPQEVVIPLVGFTVSVSQGSLSANWSCQPSHYWSELDWEGLPPQRWTRTDPATIHVGYSLSSKPTVDPVSDQVTFPGSGTVSVKPDAPGWLAGLFGQYGIPDMILQGIKGNVRAG